jgi:hypothetical protein
MNTPNALIQPRLFEGIFLPIEFCHSFLGVYSQDLYLPMFNRSIGSKGRKTMFNSEDEVSAVRRVEVELVDDANKFFAPVSNDLLDELLGQYQALKARILAFGQLIEKESTGAISYFLDAYAKSDQHRHMPSVCELFKVDRAIAALNAAYWSKTMNLTDVYDAMPQKRRDEWNNDIREMTTPEFEEGTVRSTISNLLAMRSQFFAERVDGIFRALSGEHVTNCPEGFGKRMIIAYVLDGYGFTEYRRVGFINDLRCVVAKFMGRDTPGYNASNGLVDSLKSRWGEWVNVDGGAFKIRLYRKGTAHIEVHPDMAWRLNMVLAQLYPLAIPSQFRQKPKKQLKQFALMMRPLPFAVLELIANAKPKYGHKTVHLTHRALAKSIPAWEEASIVLQSIGATLTGGSTFEFDYSPAEVIEEILNSGCIPDQKAHQFYPTPARLAEKVIELAQIESNHECLEPSAGTGGLADFMPKEKTTCVEVSKLNANVLEAKGFNVKHADFLEWSGVAANKGSKGGFDRILANPPFSEGRWQAHTTAAAALLSKGGRLVSILPSSASNSYALPGFETAWHGPFENEFAGTSVSVVILVAERST